MKLSTHCVYTMRHSDDLRRIAATSGKGVFTENKSWKSGSEIFGWASAKGERVPIIFSAAERESGLIYWALLTDVDLEPASEDGKVRTTYAFESLRPIEPPQRQSSLRLRTGRQLSDSYIRPYAICETPSFIGA